MHYCFRRFSFELNRLHHFSVEHKNFAQRDSELSIALDLLQKTLENRKTFWAPTFYFGPPLFGPPLLLWSPAFSDPLFLVPHFGSTVSEVGDQNFDSLLGSTIHFHTDFDLETMTASPVL